MKKYAYTVTFIHEGIEEAGNKKSAIKKIIKGYEDNNAELIPCEEEIQVEEIK